MSALAATHLRSIRSKFAMKLERPPASSCNRRNRFERQSSETPGPIKPLERASRKKCTNLSAVNSVSRKSLSISSARSCANAFQGSTGRSPSSMCSCNSLGTSSMNFSCPKSSNAWRNADGSLSEPAVNLNTFSHAAMSSCPSCCNRFTSSQRRPKLTISIPSNAARKRSMPPEASAIPSRRLMRGTPPALCTSPCNSFCCSI
mmetsp:Transcript_34590/g.79101  ORF Transcript_34590/g.79101 Transcript_34590/m.79101 type:complete len:203 (+) Transcript_34590:3436-4044(+)